MAAEESAAVTEYIGRQRAAVVEYIGRQRTAVGVLEKAGETCPGFPVE